MVRVVLVEDNRSFRDVLELLLGLEAEMEVVGSYESGADALAGCREHGADVVLIDYRMPGMNGAQTTSALRDVCPGAAVVCLTASISQSEADVVLNAGAVSFLTKDAGLEQIIQAIHAAAPIRNE